MSVSVAAKLRDDLHGRWLDPEIEQLLRTSVDDLVKYKIIGFLHEHPRANGDAVFFASALGFHSLPKTKTALEELAFSGILRRWTSIDPDKTSFGLTSDQRTLRLLERICEVNQHSPTYGEILRRLSAGSLKKAEASARKPRTARKATSCAD